MLFMGLDVGTQGVRCVVVDEVGGVRAAHSVAFDRINIADTPGWYEQSPGDWEAAIEVAITRSVAMLKEGGLSPEDVASVSIDGTSGTIVPLDADNRPLCAALMYNDPRAQGEAIETGIFMHEYEHKLGLTFNASFSLPRILWVMRNRPDIYDKTRVFAHQADYAVGLLCGEYAVSDYSNALKTGYDLIDGRWPDVLHDALGLALDKLPRIVRPGAPIAPITKAAAARLGLSPRTMVTGGSTDGYASALAAGAVRAGNWASIIGTTFVLKGVTERLIIDENGSSYSHMLPDGSWMLGGASNIGGRCLNAARGDRPFDELNRAAEALVPTGARCYPLTGRGERFPFVDPEAEAFYRGDILHGKLYPALMEGVAFAERLAFERMQALGGTIGPTICAAGGACRSDLWLRIRASVLNRPLAVPAVVDAAMGSALLAALGHFGTLEGAARAMIRYERSVDPVEAWTRQYDETYAQFREDCARLYKLEAR